jgi:hypothetical protein
MVFAFLSLDMLRTSRAASRLSSRRGSLLKNLPLSSVKRSPARRFTRGMAPSNSWTIKTISTVSLCNNGRIATVGSLAKHPAISTLSTAFSMRLFAPQGRLLRQMGVNRRAVKIDSHRVKAFSSGQLTCVASNSWFAIATSQGSLGMNSVMYATCRLIAPLCASRISPWIAMQQIQGLGIRIWARR